MCGIAGVFHFDTDRSVDRTKLGRMTDKLHHRGPDASGFFVEKNIGLGHRRLSIIDLESGDQPQFSEDGDICLVFNGEIYNYIELREELKSLGHKFKTTSDTEVIIKAYQQYGVDCQEKFNGMWAFAIWDKRKERLFLSRDRIGEKPLFYCKYDNSLIFASELSAIFEYGIPRKLRTDLIEVYLVLTNIPEPHTFYEGVQKLKAGHFVLSTVDGLKEQAFWNLPEVDESRMRTDKEAIYEEFQNLFENSVKIRMRCDVPFGAFLSGGLDSSSIVSQMSKHTQHPVRTFTIGFPHKAYDESDLAQLVSEEYNTNHTLGTVNPNSFQNLLAISKKHFGEPFGDSSAIPTYQVSQFASEQVKVILTGDGGDEVLSGYSSYQGVKFSSLYSQLPGFVGKSLPSVSKFLAKGLTGKLRYKLNKVSSVLDTANLAFADRMANKSAYVPLPIIKQLTANINNVIPIESYLADELSKNPFKDDFYSMMHLHLKYNLPNDYLVKVDRMSMANSLETRAPFLDYRLIELMYGVHKNVKMQGWERKSVLRNTIGQQLPKKILNAPKKGFGVPLREWFKQDSYMEDLGFNKTMELLSPPTLQKIVNNNRQGLSDNGNFLWILMMLEQFLSSD